MKFTMLYVECEDSEKEKKDLMITNEDLISKILSYLEFWKQKKADKITVQFIIQCLR